MNRQLKSNIMAALSVVNYRGYTFQTGGVDRVWIQATFMAPCSVNGGAPTVQFTRKWYISQEATLSEIIQTAFKLVLTSVEHEAREAFTYRGRAIFGPHFHVDALYSICEGGLDRREENPSLQEAFA